MARSDEKSKEIRDKIRDMYIFFHKSASAIERELNGDSDVVR